MSPALTVPALLRAAQVSDPGRPRLTWYGADGERVELSARVLANWVAKTANLLVEELLDPPAPGQRPGQRPGVLLDLPVHWRSVVWGLAAWAVGAQVAAPGGAAAVVVTAHPAGAPPHDPAGAPLVVLALPALAMAADGVPPGALDYNAVVAGYGDDLPPGLDPLPLDPLPLDPLPVDVPVTAGAAPRVLLEAAGSDLPGVLRAVAAALAADGSVVLRGPGAPAAAHLRQVERVTA